MSRFAEGATVLARRAFELSPGERLLCSCISQGGGAWHAFAPGCQRWPSRQTQLVDEPASIRLLTRRANAERSLETGLNALRGASS